MRSTPPKGAAVMAGASSSSIVQPLRSLPLIHNCLPRMFSQEMIIKLNGPHTKGREESRRKGLLRMRGARMGEGN